MCKLITDIIFNFITERVMYVLHTTEALSCNYGCRGKRKCITYSDDVLVALGIQHRVRMRYIVICCMFGSTKFFYIIS